MTSRQDSDAAASSADFAVLLSGADCNSRIDQVIAMIDGPAAFAKLWSLLAHADPLVRLRAADAADKASRNRPELLASSRPDLALTSHGDEAGEHACQIVPFASRLALSADEAARLMRRLEDTMLNHPSDFIRTEALRAAFALAAEHRRLQPRARALAKDAKNSSGPELALLGHSLLCSSEAAA